LRVTEHELEDGKKELFFHLTGDKVDNTREGGRPLPNHEKGRRSKINKLKVQLELKVNGHKVASSKKKYLSFPSYDTDMTENF
jgi:hypothetical protein